MYCFFNMFIRIPERELFVTKYHLSRYTISVKVDLIQLYIHICCLLPTSS